MKYPQRVQVLFTEKQYKTLEEIAARQNKKLGTLIREVVVCELLSNIFHMLNKKQIDNLSKYCYDTSKLVMGLMVIGNLISDKFSKHSFWIGIVVDGGN